MARRVPDVAGQQTPATRVLGKLGIAHSLHAYPHDPRNGSYGLEASRVLGVAPERVLKTLVAEVDGVLTIGVVPVACQLDLKALAAAAGGKKASMVSLAAAERATGYVAGGISPLGHRKRLPVVVDSSALRFATVYCSAGRRGLEIELAPADLITPPELRSPRSPRRPVVEPSRLAANAGRRSAGWRDGVPRSAIRRSHSVIGASELVARRAADLHCL